MKKIVSVFALLCMAMFTHTASAQKGAIDDGTITASIPFQGYNETSPVYGQLQYRIFYHTNNNNLQKNIGKSPLSSQMVSTLVIQGKFNRAIILQVHTLQGLATQ